MPGSPYWYALAVAALLPACRAMGEAQGNPPVSGEAVYAHARGRYDLYRVRLGAAGDTATGRLLRPRGVQGPLPAVLLNDGRELNSAALEYLPPEFGDLVVLSLDYPESVPYQFKPT